ncbi:MAG: hypothetical protein BGN88_14055 [Clostridiales bacterium 43-6]|nr:MAG: hypothetical protein BGN88_14055 [Clostridiales bacterium 43-6]
MSLLKPDIYAAKITDITLSMLSDNGIKGLLLDIDNTSAKRKVHEPMEGFENWLQEMKQNSIQIMFLSNANPKRVRPFAEKIGLPFYYFTCKPFPLRILLAAKRLGVPVKHIALVGDQIFTDIIGGNLSFMKTVLVDPIELEDGLNYKIKRYLERKIMKNFKKSS